MISLESQEDLPGEMQQNKTLAELAQSLNQEQFKQGSRVIAVKWEQDAVKLQHRLQELFPLSNVQVDVRLADQARNPDAKNVICDRFYQPLCVYKQFLSTIAQGREQLAEQMYAWIEENPSEIDEDIITYDFLMLRHASESTLSRVEHKMVTANEPITLVNLEWAVAYLRGTVPPTSTQQSLYELQNRNQRSMNSVNSAKNLDTLQNDSHQVGLQFGVVLTRDICQDQRSVVGALTQDLEHIMFTLKINESQSDKDLLTNLNSCHIQKRSEDIVQRLELATTGYPTVDAILARLITQGTIIRPAMFHLMGFCVTHIRMHWVFCQLLMRKYMLVREDSLYLASWLNYLRSLIFQDNSDFYAFQPMKFVNKQDPDCQFIAMELKQFHNLNYFLSEEIIKFNLIPQHQKGINCYKNINSLACQKEKTENYFSKHTNLFQDFKNNFLSQMENSKKECCSYYTITSSNKYMHYCKQYNKQEQWSQIIQFDKQSQFISSPYNQIQQKDYETGQIHKYYDHKNYGFIMSDQFQRMVFFTKDSMIKSGLDPKFLCYYQYKIIGKIHEQKTKGKYKKSIINLKVVDEISFDCTIKAKQAQFNLLKQLKSDIAFSNLYENNNFNHLMIKNKTIKDKDPLYNEQNQLKPSDTNSNTVN